MLPDVRFTVPVQVEDCSPQARVIRSSSLLLLLLYVAAFFCNGTLARDLIVLLIAFFGRHFYFEPSLDFKYAIFIGLCNLVLPKTTIFLTLCANF